MAEFDDREDKFEKKFAHDATLKFRAEARRNKLLAQWAGEKLGKDEAEIAAYVGEVIKADLEEAGDDDVFRKIRADFDQAGVDVGDSEIRRHMNEFLAQAVQQVQTD